MVKWPSQLDSTRSITVPPNTSEPAFQKSVTPPPLGRFPILPIVCLPGSSGSRQLAATLLQGRASYPGSHFFTRIAHFFSVTLTQQQQLLPRRLTRAPDTSALLTRLQLRAQPTPPPLPPRTHIALSMSVYRSSGWCCCCSCCACWLRYCCWCWCCCDISTSTAASSLERSRPRASSTTASRTRMR